MIFCNIGTGGMNYQEFAGGCGETSTSIAKRELILLISQVLTRSTIPQFTVHYIAVSNFVQSE